jgi:ABC-type dipeptide/oligopeptide/nickel transport system permease subunit
MTVKERLCTAAVAAIVMVGLFGPAMAPHDPAAVDVANRLAPTSARYPLGTDGLGRCVLSRMLYAGRVTIFSSLAVTLAGLTVGTVVGLAGGYSGGRADAILGYLVNVFLSFPALLLALVFVSVLGPGLQHGIAALAAAGWMRYARVVRGIVRTTRQLTYVHAARAMGAGPLHVVRFHLLPAAAPALWVMAVFGVANAILALAVLSFLGLGAVPPTPEWGAMIEASRPFLRTRPGLLLWPAFALVAFAATLHWAGETLRGRERLGLEVER